MVKISIVMPVYNDEKFIGDSIERAIEILDMMFEDYELIVVDDGSTDDTGKIIVRYDATIMPVLLCENRGKGAAFMAGVKRATHEYVVMLDSDLQIEPYELDPFFKLMNIYNADVVIGNKRHDYSITEYPPVRWLVSNTYNFMCRMLFGIRVRDTQCGLKLFKRSALLRVMPRLLVKRFAFDIELIVALQRKGIRIIDAPVNVMRRQNVGSVSWHNIVDTARDTMAVWYRKKKGWYDV